jgi:hypothetical protein
MNNANYKIIHNKRWFPSLYSDKERKMTGLFSVMPKSSLLNNLIVCWMASSGQRHFSSFETYGDFYMFQEKIDSNHHTFFEVILGEYPQKTHFDLDIELGTDETINLKVLGENIKMAVVHSINSVYQELKLRSSWKVLVYSSHGNNKCSYHIIIDGYCHETNKEAQYLYEKVVVNIDPLWVKYVDKTVYKSIQQFRLYGSQKYGSGRIKVLDSVYDSNNQNITSIYRSELTGEPRFQEYTCFRHSLISNTENCIIMNSLAPAKPKASTFTNVDEGDLTDKIVKYALTNLAAKVNMNFNDARFPYAYRETKGNFIILKRLRASRCQICKRIHEHENPYLYFIGNSIYYSCRRGEGSLFICSIPLKMMDDPFSDDVKTDIIIEGKGLNEPEDVGDDIDINNSNSDQEAGVFYLGDIMITSDGIRKPIKTNNFVETKKSEIDYEMQSHKKPDIIYNTSNVENVEFPSNDAHHSDPEDYPDPEECNSSIIQTQNINEKSNEPFSIASILPVFKRDRPKERKQRKIKLKDMDIGNVLDLLD